MSALINFPEVAIEDFTHENVRGLTLWRPWSYAVSHSDKYLENRDWEIWSWMIGKYVAIHAGKRWDEDAAKLVRRMCRRLEITQETIPSSRIVAVARIAGWIHEDGLRHSPQITDQQARVMCCSRWFGGPYGWVMGPRVVLAEPVVCKGAQGLWHLSPSIFKAVREQIDRALANGDRR